jgi:hypothetical protein
MAEIAECALQRLIPIVGDEPFFEELTGSSMAVGWQKPSAGIYRNGFELTPDCRLSIKDRLETNTHKTFQRNRRVLRIAAIALCAVALCATEASATSTPITVGTAAGYGVFTGVNETLAIGGAYKLTGNLGLANGYNVQISGNNTETGRTYYDGSGSGGQWSDSGTYAEQGGSSVNQSMSQQVSDAIAASTNSNALTATAGLADQGGSITSSVTINALTALSENVLDVSSVSLTNGTITFNDNGNSGAKYIINVTGNFSLSNTNIVLSGGATAADIIWNIEGTGKTVSITGGTAYGTFLVPQSNVTVGGGGSVTGELIAGANNLGKGYTLTEQSSGYNITSFAYVARTVSKVPEPSSIALFGAGIFAVAAFARRCKKS